MAVEAPARKREILWKGVVWGELNEGEGTINKGLSNNKGNNGDGAALGAATAGSHYRTWARRGEGGSCCQRWRTAAGVGHIMRAETWGRRLKVTSRRPSQEVSGEQTAFSVHPLLRCLSGAESSRKLKANPGVQSPEAALESRRVEIWKGAWEIPSSFSLRSPPPNGNRCCYHRKEPQAILMLNSNYYHL